MGGGLERLLERTDPRGHAEFMLQLARNTLSGHLVRHGGVLDRKCSPCRELLTNVAEAKRRLKSLTPKR